MTRSSTHTTWALGFGTLALLTPSAVLAQAGAAQFDVQRAFLPESTRFTPFYVTEARPLRDALRAGTVSEETPLLVMDRPEGKVALSTEQMTFHHVAQGDFTGVPWMVSF